jgi:serine-type D-Ala-D-Ala carboxypeptidase/endopeptidase (penicillin-binding protein 4)
VKSVLVPLALVVLLQPVHATTSNVLPLRVQSALAHRNIPDDHLSIYVENLSRDEVVLTWNADRPRTPASVVKLLTTLVALDKLGPTYTWKTDLYLRGELREGTLHGDLLLKGYGDPYLVTERMWQLQRRLRQLGVRRIDGDLLLDDSWFEVGDYDPAAFDREPLRAYNVEPNALMANYKVVRYLFTPDPDGSGVRIELEPPLDNVQIINQLAIGNGACRGYQRGIAIAPNESYDKFIFSGRFPGGCREYSMGRTALSHNAYTFGLFKSLWEESGGELTGGWKRVQLPEGLKPDLTFDSPPLADIISKVNKHSNNVMARQLLFTLAAEEYGPPGTEANGRKVVSDWLDARALKIADLTIDNGAGLSRDARMTARNLGGLLAYAYGSRFMPEYLSSLSLSGLDGTLSRRFRDPALQGVAHMKTGSLDHVSSIAGYLLGRSGDWYAAVLLLNHPDSHRGTGEEVQDALLRWLREQ